MQLPRIVIATITLLFILESSYSQIPVDSASDSTNVRRRWFNPRYIPIQFAGNIGFISAGVGYIARKDNYQLSIVYGFAPASISGVNSHLLTAKNIFHIYKFPISKKQTLIPYVALGVSVEISGNSFFTVPSNMPSDYYSFPKSIHAIASAGIKVRHMTNNVRGFKGIELFAETSTVDAYVWYKFISDEIKTHQILSLAFGIHLLHK
jgi:hypothetical protein